MASNLLAMASKRLVGTEPLLKHMKLGSKLQPQILIQCDVRTSVQTKQPQRRMQKKEDEREKTTTRNNRKAKQEETKELDSCLKWTDWKKSMQGDK